MNDEYICTICQIELTDSFCITICGHEFCSNCLNTWKELNTKYNKQAVIPCPMCRNNLNKQPNDNMLNRLKIKCHRKIIVNKNDDNHYLNYVQPWQYHNNDNTTSGIHTYTFSIYPDNYQPSGSVNASTVHSEMFNLFSLPNNYRPSGTINVSNSYNFYNSLGPMGFELLNATTNPFNFQLDGWT